MIDVSIVDQSTWRMTYLPTQTTNPISAQTQARQLAETLLEHTQIDWENSGLELVARMRESLRTAPLSLSVTEAALHQNPQEAAEAIGAVINRLDDHRWAGDVARHLVEAPSVGVLSLGFETLAVLEALCLLRTVQLVVPSRALARGLGYLRQPMLLGPAEHADTLLLPGMAFDAVALWTYRRWAAAGWAAHDSSRIIAPVVHPLVELTPLNRKAFRPPAGMVSMQRPLWP